MPFHILCKVSHTCEILDKACLNALADVKINIKFAQLVSKRQPQLMSFIRQSKCVVLSSLRTLVKLVSKKESAQSTSLSKKID